MLINISIHEIKMNCGQEKKKKTSIIQIWNGFHGEITTDFSGWTKNMANKLIIPFIKC